MKYRILPEALRDMEEIDAWVVENFGPRFAEKTETRLFDTFDLLADLPELGRSRPEVSPKPVRFFSVRPYWIVYTLGERLLIHRVYHSARDLRRLNKS